MKKALITILIILVLFPLLKGETKKTLTISWYVDNSPPCHIADGRMAGQGFCDKIQADILNELPEYTHALVNANWNRIMTDFKSAKNICKTFMFKAPERESYIAFSDPVILTPSSAVIFRKEDDKKLAPYINENKQFDLKTFLERESDLLIGIIKTQTLGPDIEPLIGPLRQTSRVYERSAQNYDGLLSMLSAKRIDIVIMIPLGVVHYLKRLDLKSEEISALPVLGARNYHVFYAGCAKEEEGDQIIGKINQILAKNHDKFASYRDEWMDASMIDAYRQVFEKISN